MKKIILTAATAGLFASAALVSFSTSSNGEVSVINKAQAQYYNLIPYYVHCVESGKDIVLCGAGSSVCFPYGSCGR
ncbi:MAG: hypothetical protein JST58_04930 [Bacteroidetes bacterium]|nr:hypothetical protein [Bacteroidota bacterium]